MIINKIILKYFCLFILTILSSLFYTFSSHANVEFIDTTKCYAEYESKIYISGTCDLYFDYKNLNSYEFTLSHKLRCDDSILDCAYHFQIYNYDNFNLWSVNFSSDFDKKAQKIQEYLGNDFRFINTIKNNEKEICAINKKSKFCFILVSDLVNLSLFTKINQLK